MKLENKAAYAAAAFVMLTFSASYAKPPRTALPPQASQLCAVNPLVYGWISKNKVVHLNLAGSSKVQMYSFNMITKKDTPLAVGYSKSVQFMQTMTRMKQQQSRSEQWMKWSAHRFTHAPLPQPEKLNTAFLSKYMVYAEAASIPNQKRLWLLSPILHTVKKSSPLYLLAISGMHGGSFHILAQRKAKTAGDIPFLPVNWRPASTDYSFVINHYLYIASAEGK